MPVFRITQTPDFTTDAEAVLVTLTSGRDEYQIHISRFHCRQAIELLSRLLDKADLEQEIRVGRQRLVEGAH